MFRDSENEFHAFVQMILSLSENWMKILFDVLMKHPIWKTKKDSDL